MFLKLVLGFCMSIAIAIGSAQNPCDGNAFPEIRDKFFDYKDADGVQHCFFRLSEKDENDTLKRDNDRTYFDKGKAIYYCSRYKAHLPQLTNGKLTEYFANITNAICIQLKHDDVFKTCRVFLGLTVQNTSDVITNDTGIRWGGIVYIKWDSDGSTSSIDNRGMEGMTNIRLYGYSGDCTIGGSMNIITGVSMMGHAPCTCVNPHSTEVVLSMCHYNPKALATPLTTTAKPKGASSTSSFFQLVMLCYAMLFYSPTSN